MLKTMDLIKELNSPTKIIILCWISKEKIITVDKLVEKTGFNRVNISKQICELHCKEILLREKEGKNNNYYLNPNIHHALISVINNVVAAYHIIDENRGEDYEKTCR
ncbi:helix-turn-helix transcriptional regulator [Spiroplasma endosymbiont of Labia minor]|uniref:helix-turn-helix transcriptional regulator n=1 Tax=Spiroplasma endosymbiont of Labia minor TaxID=3066305 RepID=UPI0030D4B3B7